MKYSIEEDATERVEEIMDMMRAIKNQLDGMEEGTRNGINPRPKQESYDEEPRIQEKNQESEEDEESDQVKMVKAIIRIMRRTRIEIPNYAESLNLEELIDLINDMEEQFTYEKVEDLKQVKFFETKLKRHVSIQ